MEMFPSQFQLPIVRVDKVGVRVRADTVGTRVRGALVGVRVGYSGQLVMPCLKAHKALASDLDGIDNGDGLIPHSDDTGVLQS